MLKWTENTSIDFNPRSLTGATLDGDEIIEGVEAFQSTLPHGSDLRSYSIGLTPSDFNPRSLTGATV